VDDTEREPDPGRPPRGPRWRLVTPLAFIGAGALLVTSAVNSGGTDLRPGEYADLADLARQETARVQRLQDQVAEVSAEVDELTSQLQGGAMGELQDTIAALELPAGLTAVEGPGLTISLEDAPEKVRESAGDNVSNTIVHQQDIQAVVNALWAGGAEAMTLQGQRVISTTGIKCVGNTVLLHGVTYSPPYVVSAIGDVDAMRRSVESSNYIRSYLRDVDAWELGWEMVEEDELRAPAFDGSVDLQHARSAAADAGEG
jgi:uncharacterized protein YlxW (UPF0749 family)